ncbi:hypothetical protein HK102_004051, partial [Quaeritorhiza haematococci]
MPQLKKVSVSTALACFLVAAYGPHPSTAYPTTNTEKRQFLSLDASDNVVFLPSLGTLTPGSTTTWDLKVNGFIFETAPESFTGAASQIVSDLTALAQNDSSTPNAQELLQRRLA